MYICICNALGEKTLKTICSNTCPKDGESALKHAGCKAECGQCIDYIESFLLPDTSIPATDHPNL